MAHLRLSACQGCLQASVSADKVGVLPARLVLQGASGRMLRRDAAAFKRGSCAVPRVSRRPIAATATGTLRAQQSAPPDTTCNCDALDQQAAQLGVQLTPLHKNFGVMVQGLDLSQELSEAVKQLLLAAMREYDMLLFRGQVLHPSDEERVLTLFPYDKQALQDRQFSNAIFKERIPDHPLITVRANGVDLKDHFGLTTDVFAQKQPQGILPFSEHRVWHMDASDYPCPPEVSSIYVIQNPPEGADTVFASAVAAFENLSDELKAHVLQLQSYNARGTGPIGFHMSENGVRRLDDMDAKIAKAKEEGNWTEQPLLPFVIQDPDTGKRSLLLSTQLLHSFHGMSREDSLALLDQVLAPALVDSEVYSLKWQPHDFAIWANRRLIHSASPTKDWANEHSRLIHLVFLDSDQPVVPAATV